MANRDYVRRGRGTPKKTTKKQPSRKKPWRSGLLAVLLVGGFGYGLYLLSTDPEPEKPVAKQEPVKTSKPKPKKELPPPPEEKWEYVESLPSREVEVVAKEIEVSKIPYIMQCGAYKTQAQAEDRKLAIAFQGISSQIRKKEGSSWYRVVLGPYKFKRDAEKDRHKLQRAKIEPCAIWKETL
ncbi:cell division protein FtsN [Vibrio rotiferianus]|uniref:Cell division protein FtsN n=1 Tax=Vibrio rotiferianus TaxID=190895 RepID=A0A510I2A1_9VIBR|nr:cell division protein FtsN [Vibrio rotiferianus]HCE2178874.1 cell division protein FtsN [Vibrio parahaemolyticus]ASI97552.1 cell division protein FtsN [Vibrio rotiferianus]TMX44412.1 cell division protein FtsN [Vibrio rotiferianus]TMX48807.1 cell division protein FtsN [Vibrio rotiferianus]TMX62032.1 cell division protein FtsN [Vibrio rotiferianus]